MKNNYFFIFIVACFNVFAEPTCSNFGTRIVYTNGVNTSFEDATKAKNTLASFGISGQIDKKVDKVEYVLKYNYNEGLAKDFLEAIVQRFPQDYLDSIKADKWKAFILFITGNLTSVPVVVSKAIEQDFLELTKEFIETRANLPLYNQNVMEIADSYLRALDGEEQMRVLAISHSQGGLFMNDAYELLIHPDKEKFLAGFQIATPVDNQPMKIFGYQTHGKDRLISFVRDQIGALVDNMEVPLFVNNTYNSSSDYLDFFLNHGITTTYLYDTDLKEQVISALIETAQKLKSSCGEPPVAKFTYASRALDPLFPNPMTYDFDGSTSTDADEPDPNDPTPVEPPDFDIEKFEWLVDGSIPLTGMNPSYTFLTEGPHTVQLIVTDKQGAKSEPVEQLLTVINIAPKADFTFTKQDLKVTFDGSTSKDVDGKIAEYRWKVEGVETILTTSTFIYTFENGGIFDVELTVVDSNGKVSTPITRPVIFSSVWCEDSQGNLFPGTIHVNPDGTPGGYVANTASVASGVIISKDSQVCGYARIKGDV